MSQRQFWSAAFELTALTIFTTFTTFTALENHPPPSHLRPSSGRLLPRVDAAARGATQGDRMGAQLRGRNRRGGCTGGKVWVAGAVWVGGARAGYCARAEGGNRSARRRRS